MLPSHSRHLLATAATAPVAARGILHQLGCVAVVVMTILVVPLARSGAVEVADVRLGRHPDKVRIVLDTDGSGSFRPAVSEDGRRVRIDFDDVQWHAPVSTAIPGVDYLSAWRFEPVSGRGGRFLVEARRPVRLVAAFGLDAGSGHTQARYVLDLAPVSPQLVAAAAGGGSADLSVADPAHLILAAAESDAGADAFLPIRPERKPETPKAEPVPVPAQSDVVPIVPPRKPRPGATIAAGPARPPVAEASLPPAIDAPSDLSDAALAEHLQQLEQAALLGNVGAMTRLGKLSDALAEDQGGGPALAFAWYRKAAERADTTAAFAVAQAYRLGRGIPRSDALAAYWYGKAAEAGLAAAQINLAILKLRGLGYGVLPESGVDLLRKAAEQGNEQARQLLNAVEASGTLPVDAAFAS